jgi:F0F1-type ATP synthase membrane subunit b/b'
MSAFVIAILAATLGILVVMAISLMRQLRRLSGTLREFATAINPALADIQREGDRAQALAERIERRRREAEEEKEQSRAGPSRRGGRRR